MEKQSFRNIILVILVILMVVVATTKLITKDAIKEKEDNLTFILRQNGYEYEERLDELRKENNDLRYEIKDREQRLRKLDEEAEKLKREKANQEQEKQTKDTKKPKTVSRGGMRISAPSNTSTFKSYMDYRSITSRNSLQYKLQQQAKTNAQGFRVLNGNYMVALGSGFGKVGDYVRVEMDNGSFNAVIADQKADVHTDPTNKYHLSDNSVIEFIVDTGSLESSIKTMGDCSYASAPNLKGKVKNIVNLSR